MKIICRNHYEFHSITEILRLYFKDIAQPEGRELYLNDDFLKNYILCSESSEKITKEEIKNQDDRRNIIIKSFIKETDLIIEASVVPSQVRREIKRQTYYLLSHLADIHYPWGSLTGIRPTQIIYQNYLKLSKNTIKTKKELVDYWYLTPEKAALGLETAIAEQKILNDIQKDLPMLYIGIPFCRTRCSYCSFITRDATKQKQDLSFYVSALIQEIKETSQYFKSLGKSFQAIYVGGGTPTALTDRDFYSLIKTIKQEIPITNQCEITIEAGRPDSITRKKLETIKNILPDARICINPQTMHDKTLELIGRDHTVKEVGLAFDLARNIGFNTINMDLILGLPGEDASDFLDSLDKILTLEPENITIHSLALKRSAYLAEKFNKKYMNLRFPDRELTMTFEKAIDLLKENSFKPYYMYRQKNARAGLENIGFAKSGYNCIYNVGMMSDQVSVIGLGSGSSTKIIHGTRVSRFYNPKDLLNYGERINELIEKKLGLYNRKLMNDNY